MRAAGVPMVPVAAAGGGDVALPAVVPRGGSLEVPSVLPVRTLSPSSIERWERCPAQWAAHYIDRTREPKRLPMVVGTAVGNTLAAFFALRIEGKAELSLADADDRVLAEFDRELRAVVLRDDDDPAAEREACREPLRHYLAEVAPGIRPVAVERRPEARFPGAEWTVKGYPDLETEDGDIIDFKVKGKHVRKVDAEKSVQTRTYLLLRALEGAPARRFLFHSLRRGAIREESDRFREVEVTVSELGLRRHQARIAQVAREIAQAAATGDFGYRPDHWLCAEGKCPVFSICPGGGGGLR